MIKITRITYAEKKRINKWNRKCMCNINCLTILFYEVFLTFLAFIYSIFFLSHTHKSANKTILTFIYIKLLSLSSKVHKRKKKRILLSKVKQYSTGTHRATLKIDAKLYALRSWNDLKAKTTSGDREKGGVTAMLKSIEEEVKKKLFFPHSVYFTTSFTLIRFFQTK